MRLLYTLAIYIYGLAIWLAAPFVPKARKWISGRKQEKSAWPEHFPQKKPVIWIHCASLGEFEQARPILEAIREEAPHAFLLLTFFSPSGYEIRKDFDGVDRVAYLPLDTPARMHKLVGLVRPQLVLLIKYELWLNWLYSLRKAKVPVVMISARLTAKSRARRSPVGALYRQQLQQMAHIFTQDTSSQARFFEWLKSENSTLGGDTRYDRVTARRSRWQALPEIAAFVGARQCIVVGSSWPQDEQLVLDWAARELATANVCLIMAPHEIHSERILTWQQAFPQETLIYSQVKDWSKLEGKILWLDTIGMLASVYAYADVAYVGGAFGTGLHNILEPAAFGCPILFGPYFDRFPEAKLFIDASGAFSVKNVRELEQVMGKLLADDQLRRDIIRTNKNLVAANTGATERVMAYLRNRQGFPAFETK